MKLGRTVSRSWQRLFWLLPLLPLIIVTDLTALLWLGGTALVLVFVKDSRAPTFAFVYRNWWTSIIIGLVVGLVIHFLIDPVVIPWLRE